MFLILSVVSSFGQLLPAVPVMDFGVDLNASRDPRRRNPSASPVGRPTPCTAAAPNRIRAAPRDDSGAVSRRGMLCSCAPQCCPRRKTPRSKPPSRSGTGLAHCLAAHPPNVLAPVIVFSTLLGAVRFHRRTWTVGVVIYQPIQNQIALFLSIAV